jgi:hypothetical protein
MLEQRERQIQYRNRWAQRIKKLRLMGHANVLHHDIEGKLANLFFKHVGRVDRGSRKSIKSLVQYLNMTPWTPMRELRLRAELLFCKPMKRKAHTKLHRYLQIEGGF